MDISWLCSGLPLLRAELEEKERRSEQWRQKWFKIKALIELRCALRRRPSADFDLPVSGVTAALMALRARSSTNVTIKVKMIVTGRNRRHSCGTSCESMRIRPEKMTKFPFLDSQFSRADVDSSRLTGQRPDIESDAMVGQFAGNCGPGSPIPFVGRDSVYRTR